MKKLLLPTLLLVSFLFFNCSNNSSEEEIILEDVTYELVSFVFTPDTGNDSSRLEYQVRFINPNNVDIRGFYGITINADGLISTRLSTSNSPCYEIAANSNCVVSFEGEDPHSLGMINNVIFVSAEYTIEQ